MPSYDAHDKPKIDPQALAEGKRLGLIPIQVVCDERTAKVGDIGGVSFFAFVKFIPRIGETLLLEDGKTCRVYDVIHKVVTTGKFTRLIPVVGADLETVPPKKKK